MTKDYDRYLNNLGIRGEDRDAIKDYVKNLLTIAINCLNNKDNNKRYD